MNDAERAWRLRIADELDPLSPAGDDLFNLVHTKLELLGRAEDERAVSIPDRHTVLYVVAAAIRELTPPAPRTWWRRLRDRAGLISF
jgi:hypothetical protein